MDCRTIFFVLLLGLGSACARNSVVNNNILTKLTPSPTPIQELAIPSNWKTFQIGPFQVLGPDSMKKKNVKGIDSEVYRYENKEFFFDIAIGDYECVDGKLSETFSEHENGSIMINNKEVKFTKYDINKPSGYAATNADGSRSKPVEKHLVLEACIPKKNALVSIGYAEESSTHLAMAMLQSIRQKKE